MKSITIGCAVLALGLAACGQSGGGGDSNDAGSATPANAAAPETGNSSEAAAPAANATGEATGGETAAQGAQQDFTIVNNTGQTVMTLNVSPSDQNSWGPDILGQNVLANGQQGQVSFARGQEQCNWDVRATYENGQTGDWRNINLCQVSTITLTAE